jgi:hypothetical protein
MSKKKVKKAKRNVKTELRKAMKACKKKGIRLVTGVWGTSFSKEKGYFVPNTSSFDEEDRGSVCAMGALLVHKNGSIKFDKYRGRRPLTSIEAADAAAFVLGVSDEWVGAFISGFDGSPLESVGHIDKYYCSDTGLIRIDRKDEKAMELKRAFNMGKELAEEFSL